MAYSRTSMLNCEKTLECECNVEAALSIVGGRGKLKIYKHLRDGRALRFSELHKILEEISEKTLTSQLREMEKDKLVSRIVYAEVPPRVEYKLTDLGKALEPVLKALEDWGTLFLNAG